MTIFKLGGSLLEFPGLAGLIESLRRARGGQPVLWLAGGGAPADAVRAWDRVHGLAPDAAHDLALGAMDLTGQLLARLVPALRPVRSVQQVQMAARDGVPGLLCADCFIRSAEAQGQPPLERSWRVTSDSIGAWVARILESAELVLVKSVPLPPGITLQTAARAGLVDEAFPELARGLPQIGWVNARSQSPVVQTWEAGAD